MVGLIVLWNVALIQVWVLWMRAEEAGSPPDDATRLGGCVFLLFALFFLSVARFQWIRRVVLHPDRQHHYNQHVFNSVGAVLAVMGIGWIAF